MIITSPQNLDKFILNCRHVDHVVLFNSKVKFDIFHNAHISIQFFKSCLQIRCFPLSAEDDSLHQKEHRGLPI